MPLKAREAPIVWYASWAFASAAWPQGTITPGKGGVKRLDVRQEQQGGDVMLRLALEDDLLDR